MKAEDGRPGSSSDLPVCQFASLPVSASPASRPRYRLWELTDRVGGGRLPRVEIVDLAVERRERPPGSPRELDALSKRLESALRGTLAAGGQAILLLNRRGFSSYVCCPSAVCGWSMRCEHCDASMVLHMRGVPVGGVVRCHHCLSEQRVPRQCPICGKRTITLGTGTQKLEEELAGKFRGGNAARGIPACMACHGPAARGVDAARFPALRGQHAVYIAKQLQDYASGTRKTGPNNIMQDIARKLSADDIRDVASYIQGIR